MSNPKNRTASTTEIVDTKINPVYAEFEALKKARAEADARAEAEARENAAQADAARLEEKPNNLFLQAVVAVKRLREYTSWVRELVPRSESRKERDYLNKVLYEFPRPCRDRMDENAQLRARLAFAEEIVHVFFRRIITENFVHEYKCH